MNVEDRVWFVTGASRGLGRAFVEAALSAGDRVVGVARDVGPLADLVAEHDGNLVVFPLDVTDRAAVFAGVDRAVETFGRLDVVVGNAGSMLFGMVEEITEEQARAHLDVNFFGALWLGQAVVPHLRRQGSGHLVQVSSTGSGGGFSAVGLYAAGKSALDAMTEALAMEVERFGVRVTILQPGSYDTELFTTGTTATEPDEVYAPLRAELDELWGGGAKDPSPELAARVLLELVDLPDPPRRLIVGSASYDQVREQLQHRVAEYGRWEDLSRRGG
ncbi:SDR family NAD(P)-dependent oxidoreductase [Umezawaea beigongshangensis]|uniref:SDR family NAD(P)-dependent oxidoreductase n=1 Tax=Umezawaea beigongshangensis TaxID=2780383 RepID=UPI0018F17143|nr:SDR family NAD(P)-dependent oxidoreductase [Umezawaea beigongshangensis]